MTPVMQSISDSKRGDCERAVIATLFDLELAQVPHFKLYTEDMWWPVFCGFIWGLGYQVEGTGHFPKQTPGDKNLADCHVNGYLDASVPSRNFPGESHAVVMSQGGVIVHDPSPIKENSWNGVNVIESGELISWTLIEMRQHE